MSQGNVENLRASLETWNGRAWTLETLSGLNRLGGGPCRVRALLDRGAVLDRAQIGDGELPLGGRPPADERPREQRPEQGHGGAQA